jgi:hypothetical protein
MLPLLGAAWTGCGGDPAEKIAPGMTFAEVTELLGEPEMKREGFTFVDSSRVAMMVRGSDVPVINFSALDSKILWIYEGMRTDTGVLSRGPGGGPVRFAIDSRFAVLFDAARGTVIGRGYYPLSVVRVR